MGFCVKLNNPMKARIHRIGLGAAEAAVCFSVWLLPACVQGQDLPENRALEQFGRLRADEGQKMMEPLNSLYLSPRSIELSNQLFQITMPAISGKTYLLEYKNSLQETQWIATAFIANPSAQIVLSDPKDLGTNRFYRVALDPLSSLEAVARTLVERAKDNDLSFLAQYLDEGFKDQAAQLAEMINRSGMLNNYQERAHIASFNLLRLDYHDLKNRCHFQVDLDHIDGGWKLKRIWFCR